MLEWISFRDTILSNQVLDRMTASLLREISYSIAKMTDKYALSIFDLSFGHSIERINQYIDKNPNLHMGDKFQ